MFDSQRFNGFVSSELGDHLLNDIWEHYIFNESDLHSAAYHYIRKYFEKKDDKIFVRCEPVMSNGSKPDIVVFKRYDPLYMIELKMFKKPDMISTERIEEDLNKLKHFLSTFPRLKWGFQIVVYDSDEMFKPSPLTLRKRGYQKISVMTVNLRRFFKTNRRRPGYDDWREQYDRFLERHV